MFYDSVDLLSERKLVCHILFANYAKSQPDLLITKRNKSVEFFSKRNFSMETLTSFPTVIPKIVFRIFFIVMFGLHNLRSTFRLYRNAKLQLDLVITKRKKSIR